MKICLVGGIFDATAERRAKHTLTPETILVEGFRGLGVHVHGMGHSRFVPSSAYDIVHVHHIGKAALKMASEESRARFVFTSHDGPILNGYEKSLPRKAAFRYITNRADALVALSRNEAAFLDKLGTGAAIEVIPNGIPADVFRPDANCQPPQEKAADAPIEILYVGQLIALKGIDVLLDALGRLREKWNTRLSLVYHNSQLEASFRQRARELGIADRVEFVGAVASPELAQRYRQTDLVVLPSHAEALPSVVTEALLCGKPVVASAVGGIPEQVGDYGRVVTPGNVDELAAALDSVLGDLPSFRARADEMRRYAQARFNVDTMVRSHLALYEGLLRDSKGARRRGRAWLDPLVRVAVALYWSRKKLNGKT